jgi:hypothetical protein
MYCNVLCQYCCQYPAQHQYYNIIISQPEVLMTHSVSTNMQYECKIMNSAIIIVINMPLQNPQLFIYLSPQLILGYIHFQNEIFLPALKRTHL